MEEGKIKVMINENPKVKILVGYHKPAVLLKDEILTPIHLGRALATQVSKDGEMSKEDFKWMCENMIGDDTGDNISHLNRYFCELTGIYWAWKNYDKLGNPDYIGFMHYRRIFDFNSTILSESDSLNNLINEKIIEDIVSKNQRIFLAHHKCNPYEQYKNISFHKIEDYDNALNIINSNFKKFSAASIRYNKENCCYFYNMFILPKEDFFEYCEFIFGVLFKLKEQTNFLNRNIQEVRLFGYIAERLMGIYFTELKARKANYKEFPMFYCRDKIKKERLVPLYTDSIKLCFSVDNLYIIYLYATIVSIIQHSTSDQKYEIFLLYSNLDANKVNYFYDLQRDNIFIRFIKIDEYVDKIDYNFFVDRHATIAAYYRLFIPEIFLNFDKVLYLDCDLIACDDIKNIYNTNIQNHIIAATKDPCLISDLNENPGFMNYCINELELENPLNYFQSGVMLFNIKKCIQFNLFDKCIKKIKKIKKPVFWDQDILNSVLQDNVKFLKLECNVEWTFFEHEDRLKKYLSLDMYKEYGYAYSNPIVLHYNGFKPWSHPHLPKADIWWHYARQTPFYEEILFKNIKDNVLKNLPSNHVNLIHVKPCGAVEKVKSHLSFKLGKEILSIKENKLKILALPFTLIFITIKHKISNSIYKLILNSNPNLKSLPLSHYSDYHEALKIQNYLSYRLGNLLVKHPFTFIFRVSRVYREWKKGK